MKRRHLDRRRPAVFRPRVETFEDRTLPSANPFLSAASTLPPLSVAPAASLFNLLSAPVATPAIVQTVVATAPVAPAAPTPSVTSLLTALGNNVETAAAPIVAAPAQVASNVAAPVLNLPVVQPIAPVATPILSTVTNLLDDVASAPATILPAATTVVADVASDATAVLPTATAPAAAPANNLLSAVDSLLTSVVDTTTNVVSPVTSVVSTVATDLPVVAPITTPVASNVTTVLSDVASDTSTVLSVPPSSPLSGVTSTGSTVVTAVVDTTEAVTTQATAVVSSTTAPVVPAAPTQTTIEALMGNQTSLQVSVGSTDSGAAATLSATNPTTVVGAAAAATVTTAKGDTAAELEASAAATIRAGAPVDLIALPTVGAIVSSEPAIDYLPWATVFGGLNLEQPVASGAVGASDVSTNPSPTGLGAADAVAAIEPVAVVESSGSEADVNAEAQSAGFASFALDPTQIAQALGQFADRLDGLRMGATDWLAEHPSMVPWLTVVATAVAAGEFYRRRQRALDEAAVAV